MKRPTQLPDLTWFMPLSEPENWQKDRARATEIGQKAKRRTENKKQAIEKHVNESKRQRAQRRKEIVFKLRDRLIEQYRTLRQQRKTSELAMRIWANWPKNEYPRPSIDRIRHLLTEK
jgi:hypothetical protein